MSQTAQYIVQAAYEDAGKVGIGVNVSTNQMTRGLLRLADMINLWATQGLKLWLWQTINIPLVQGQSLYTLNLSGNVVMTQPLQAITAYYLDSTNTNSRPLMNISQTDYALLANKSQQSAVNSFTIIKTYNSFNIQLWPVPDNSGGSVNILLRTHASVPVLSTDTIQFPDEWTIALRWGLADEICTGSSREVQQRCEQRASAYRKALENWDVESADVKFGIDIVNPGSSLDKMPRQRLPCFFPMSNR